MPPAASSRRATRDRPARPSRTTALGAAAMRVRWDRVGRVTLLLMLLLVAGLYVGPARSYVSTWSDSNAKHERLHELEREHERLEQQANHLRDPRTTEAEARRLGMVRPGERSYVVTGLPRD